MALLEIENLKKHFIAPDGASVSVVNLPRFDLGAGAQVGLRGPSGAGKTTLLNLIAGILRPDSGSIRLAGEDVTRLSESKRDRLRATTIGFVFQTFNLLQGYSCLENVLLGMKFGPGIDHPFALSLLERVGLKDRLNYLPRQLSSGQQQRVAVARALANRPRLVLADEPTGNLDPSSSRDALALMRELCHENGAALLVTSHDQVVLSTFDDMRELNVSDSHPAEARP